MKDLLLFLNNFVAYNDSSSSKERSNYSKIIVIWSI